MLHISRQLIVNIDISVFIICNYSRPLQAVVLLRSHQVFFNLPILDYHNV